MILVTGSNSFLGKKLVQKLTDEGNTVRCLDIDRPKNLQRNAEFMQGDVLDLVVLKKACAGVEAIVHLMDVRRPGKINRRLMKKINVQGTRNVLQMARVQKVPKLFFNSTFEIYGKSKALPIAEDVKRKKPATPYGKDKLKAELLCQDYQKRNWLAVTVFRPAVIAGAEIDDTSFLITLYMALGMPDGANRFYLAGNGTQRAQMVHPDDVVAAYAAALKSNAVAGKIYNLGADNVPTQAEQIAEITKKAKLNAVVKHMTPGFTKFFSFIIKPFKVTYLTKDHVFMLLNNIVLDCKRAKEELGWKPGKDNIGIMMEAIEWYRKAKKV